MMGQAELRGEKETYQTDINQIRDNEQKKTSSSYLTSHDG